MKRLRVVTVAVLLLVTAGGPAADGTVAPFFVKPEAAQGWLANRRSPGRLKAIQPVKLRSASELAVVRSKLEPIYPHIG